MRDQLLGFLSRDWSGLAIAVIVAAFGALLRGLDAPAWLWVPLLAIGLLLAIGAAFHVYRVSATVARHPPPGRMVDVGGFRLHVLAEGERPAGRPAVVWFGGGHASGASMHHLHRELRTHTRSILVDRAGTGWSDAGPYPRTTAGEAEECLRALEAAGEGGPYVLAGHSFGGFLAARMARSRPDLVKTLVLLDATPPDTIIFGPRFGALREMRRGAWIGGLLRLFGVHQSPLERAQRKAAPQLFEALEDQIGEPWKIDQALGVRSRVSFSMASIFGELSPEGMARCAADAAVYDGDLGDLPVLLVAPGDIADAREQPELGGADPVAVRMQRVVARSRERYLAISSRSRRVITPPGTTHVFPNEVPGFVVDLVRREVD